MFSLGNNKISTESYKGVRDFYPETQAVQNYIFKVMRETVEKWGYLEYGASVLEPLDLYKAKSSEEIVNEQIYSFTDRGDREVALRPEMTPTVSRMVGAKIQELPAPIRWYSIPNLFRYEKPQRGRLREHWQLNVDMFGVVNPYSDAEIISVASSIMLAYGAKTEDFVIKVNSRALLDDMFAKNNIPKEKIAFVYRLIDKKEKMPEADFRHAMSVLVGEESAEKMLEMLYWNEGILTFASDMPSAQYLNDVICILKDRGVSNVVFSPTITRGFDYYTGIVFEVFDTNKENPRSIFGGGRYDNLVGSFASTSVPACGFGMGDVTIRDFLITHNLMPKLSSTTDVFICVAPDTSLDLVYSLAEEMRSKKINVAVDISGRKLGDQLKSLDKRNVPFVMTVGSEELQSKIFTLRNTETREEKKGGVEEIVEILKNR